MWVCILVKNKYPQWVGDVRGNGLFQGVEIVQLQLVNGKTSVEPYAELTKFLVDHLRCLFQYVNLFLITFSHLFSLFL